MRKARQLREGACYHVTARINRKEMLLAPESVKAMFLSILKRAKKKYSFHLINFCVMDNHIHLMIHPCRGTCLSSIMQWILSVFAMAYNRKNNLTGHVWGERFFSRILNGIGVFRQVFEYIDQNPVRSGYVTLPQHWRWGGSWHYRTGCHSLVDDFPNW